MQDAYQTLILPDVQQMLQEGDLRGLSEFCKVVHPAAVAEILEELEDSQIWTILDQAELPLRVEIFEYISLRRQTALVELRGAYSQNVFRQIDVRECESCRFAEAQSGSV